MTDLQATGLIDEMIVAISDGKRLPNWITQRCDDSVDTELMSEGMCNALCDALCDATVQLLTGESPHLAHWERLIMAVAIGSTETESSAPFDACAAAITRLADLIENGDLDQAAHEDVVTLGSSLTLLLATQRKLHQRIEYAVGLLGNRHPKSLGEMAERCEELWLRCGQMSGATNLFVWDQRHEEWRLAQDFKAYRPEEA